MLKLSSFTASGDNFSFAHYKLFLQWDTVAGNFFALFCKLTADIGR